jgi:hypothetical protein
MVTVGKDLVAKHAKRRSVLKCTSQMGRVLGAVLSNCRQASVAVRRMKLSPTCVEHREVSSHSPDTDMRSC